MNIQTCTRCQHKFSQKENQQTHICDKCTAKYTRNQVQNPAPIVNQEQEDKRKQNSPVDDVLGKKVCIENKQEQKEPIKLQQKVLEQEPKINLKLLAPYFQVNKEQPNQISQIEIVEDSEFDQKFKCLVSSGRNLVLLSQEAWTSMHTQKFLFKIFLVIPFGQPILSFKRVGQFVMLHLDDQSFHLLSLKTQVSEKFKGELIYNETSSAFKGEFNLPYGQGKIVLEGKVSNGNVSEYYFRKQNQPQQENLQEQIDFVNGHIKIENNRVKISKMSPQTGQLLFQKDIQGKVNKFKTTKDLYIFIHQKFNLHLLIVQQNGQLIETYRKKQGVTALAIFQQANNIQIYFGTKEGMLGLVQVTIK